MINTINISLPKDMYEEARKAVKSRGYASISELIRDALRDVLYPRVTVNGFTPEFEEKVIQASKSPREDDIELTTTKNITDFILRGKEPKRTNKI